jgi:hypothetical protein
VAAVDVGVDLRRDVAGAVGLVGVRLGGPLGRDAGRRIGCGRRSGCHVINLFVFVSDTQAYNRAFFPGLAL